MKVLRGRRWGRHWEMQWKIAVAEQWERVRGLGDGDDR